MASLTNAQRDQLVTLFIGMFDAAPGATYLGALVGAREAGSSLADIAAALATKPQFKELYPSVLSAEEAADRIVATLLTDETPAGAKTWSKNWVIERLSAGDSVASVLLQAVTALTATTNANYDSAQAQLANKLEVANYYSVTLLGSGTTLEELQDVLSEVTADPDSVAAAKDALDNPGEDPGTPPGEEPTDPPEPPPVGGTSETLTKNVTVGTATVVVTQADKVTLTLKATQPADPADNDGNVSHADVTLDSDAKQLTITLTAVTDNNGTASPSTDDVLDKVSLNLSANGADYAELVSLKLSGNGTAEIVNADGAALVYIDASGLSSKTITGALDAGLTLSSSNSLAEAILLGGGQDAVELTASTVSATDVVSGLTLVDDADTSGTQLDVALSDDIAVGVSGFVKLTPNSSSLNFALIAAADSGDDQLVFQYGGNTYIYADSGTAIDALDDADLLVKLVGTVNLDLLVEALNS